MTTSRISRLLMGIAQSPRPRGTSSFSTVTVAAASEARNPRLRRPPAALEVTPAAANRIRALLSRRSPPAAGVRIGLKTRGCNGMAYTLNYADKANAFDEKVEIEGAQVFIDPRALMHIVGTKMDFVDNDLVSEFVFHNPNAKGMNAYICTQYELELLGRGFYIPGAANIEYPEIHQQALRI